MSIRIVGAVAALALAAGGVWFANSGISRIYLNAGTGITAKQLCSLTFVSGLTPDRAAELYVDPLLGAASGWVSTDIDPSAGEATASILGLWRQRALYRPGLGCTLVHGAAEFDASLYLPTARPFQPMPLDEAHRDAVFDAQALDAAIEAAFADDGRNTLAVAVLQDGRLVAERYAEGVTAASPMHGWSMTKSIAALVAGAAVERGLIDIDAEGSVPALAAAGRPEITVDDLLRMTGGLAGYERNDGSDPNSEMLFTQSDMATYAATREQIHAPGETWDYQSGNTILAGSAVEAVMGETLEEKIASLRAWLFEPLNIHSGPLEVDEAGTLQWSSYAYLAAQDWARLGQLLLDDGLSPGGERLIPADWEAYVAEATPGSNGRYGSGFWLLDPENTGGALVYYMNGFQGQYGFIVPDLDLVVVRFGASNGVEPGAYTLLAGVASAYRGLPDPIRQAAEAQSPE